MNRNTVISAVLAVVLLGGGVLYFAWQRTPRELGANEIPKASEGSVVATGKIEPVADRNKALNAFTYEGVEMDQFTLVDDTGKVLVLFDPEKLSMPAPGASVRVAGHIVQQSGKGTNRFVAERFE